MDESANLNNLNFEDVIAALLDSDTPLNPRYLYRLTDLVDDELTQFEETWPEIAAWRRLALLEDLEVLYDADTLLSFEAICRRAIVDTDSHIRFQALHSLQGYDVPDLIPYFIRILQEDEKEELRAIAADIMGKYIYLGEVDTLSKRVLKEIERVLLKVAKGEDSALVRRKAVEALGYSSHEDVPSLIKKAFYAEDLNWVSSALYAMGRTLDERWEPDVLKMLVHPNPEIRLEAIRASGELEIAKAKPLLLDYLEDQDEDVQMAAVWSLSRIGGNGLKSLFENLLADAELDKDVQVIEEALDYLIFNQSIDFTDGLDLEDDLDYDYLVEDEESDY
jgi:HEAT repeat protein